MRESLLKLICDTIKFKYILPNEPISIPKSNISNKSDECFASTNGISVSEIIYNSIIDYSFNEYDLKTQDYSNLLTIALQSKLQYDENKSFKKKIGYGFHGETLLFCILNNIYNIKPVISRGYFYNPLEDSETKGYDSYHLIDNDGVAELWFGEVKFRISYTSCINDMLSNLPKTLSDEYLSKNILAITNFKNSFNISGSAIEEIILDWEKNPQIKLFDYIKEKNIKLIYPMLVICDLKHEDYDANIKKIINYINQKASAQRFDISIPFNLFFILLPINEVKSIKSRVIDWIESKKALLS